MENRGGGPISAARAARDFAGGAALGLFVLAALREVRALAGPHAAGWTAPIALFGIGAAIGASFLAERRRRVPAAAAAALASLLLLVLVIAGVAGTAAMLLFSLSVFATGAWVGARAGEEERGRSAEGARDAGASLPSALLGASAAFFAGSRLIVPAFGAAGVSLAAALLFAILAAVAIGEGRRRTADAGHEADAGNGGNAGSAGSPAGPVSIAVFVLALAALATGWGRLLDLLIGPTLRASGLYWTVLLFGGFVGAAAAGRAARSGRASGYATLFLALHALLVLLSAAVAGELPYFFLSRIKGSVGDPGVLFRARLLIVALLVFPASVAAGAALRTLLAGGAPARSRTRPFAAAASAIALAGGAILAPRLLPAIGIRGAMLAGAALSVLVALRRVAGSGWPLRARLASFLPLVVLLAIAAASPPRWKPGLLNTAVYRYAGLHERIDKEGFLRTYAIVPAFYEEGSRTTVMVAGAGGSRLLAANGSVEMSDKEHLAVQVLLGRLPLLFRPGLERVFVAGSGAGITAGTLLAGGTAEVVTVEPEPARLEAMRHFARANREPWKDGRARFEIGEPRARLARSGESFDAIVCQPSAPWDRDAAHLATAEFFRTAASRLRPGGVLATSFPVAGIGEEELRSFLAGFRSAFPHCLAFEATQLGTIVLLGSDAPFLLHVRDLEGLWTDPAAQADLLESRVRNVYDLVAQALLDEETIDRYAGSARPNRDANGLVELGSEEFATSLSGARLSPVLRALRPDPDRFLDYEGLSPEERGKFRLEVARACWRNGYGSAALRAIERAYPEFRNGPASSLYARILKQEGGDLDSAVAVLREAWGRDRSDPSIIRQLGDYLFLARRHEECERLMTSAIDAGIEDAWCYVERGKARLGLRRYEEALADLVVGKDLDRLQDNSGDINYFLAMALKALGRLEESQDYLGRTISRNPRHLYAPLEFGENKLLLGQIERPAFEEEYVLPFNRARAETLFTEAKGWLHEPEHADAVERNLIAVINTTPNHYGAYLALAEFCFREGNTEGEEDALERMIGQFGRRPEVVAEIESYLRATGGEERVRAYRRLLR